ncbi:eukaryotic translation initiation factor 2 subunit 2-like isoform X1 [Rhopilema esculentum]|uniref:eukaryotic translation initiation factor 2 subunit 2-like isoform X1 n=2 Tax=Rhopilema esculentum TaxID=499914 RepID=UPI0031D815C6
MAEEEMLFDPMMKKKKKKKVPVDFEDFENVPVQPEPEKSQEAEKNDNLEDIQEKKKEADIDLDLDDFSKMKKKKKKKKEALVENNESEDNKQDNEGPMADEEFDLSLAKKKKPKKQPKDAFLDENEEEGDEANDNEAKKPSAALAEDRDYTYDELLNRVFEIMRAKNPAMAEGGKKKFVMKPPQVVRIGTKKTSFVNFADICRILHRQPKHLLAFLLAELGTSGSVDGGNQLIIKGRFQQKQIENVLRRYIREYVTCHTCRSPDTILHKETRLFFLQCETCGSRCSVASIKSGFQALTGKRAAMKNKQ